MRQGTTLSAREPRNRSLMSYKPIRKAVFPVAGLGTRFLPATKSVPKELLPVVDRPLIQYARSEEHTSELQSLMRISYAVFCLQKKIIKQIRTDKIDIQLTNQVT